MRAGASIAKEIVRRIDELFAIERDISGKPPTNGEPRSRNGRSRWFSRLRPILREERQRLAAGARRPIGARPRPRDTARLRVSTHLAAMTANST